MQAIGSPQNTRSRGLFPVVAFVVFAALVATSTVVLGTLALLPLIGMLFVAVVVARPEYGIAFFLSTFLMTYPASLQGSGLLTINNAMGGLFLILLVYKLYREEDWWFIRSPEIRLFIVIILLYLLSDRLNGPDDSLRDLLGVQEHAASNLRTFINRVLFTVFFINFIRTAEHVRMIYLLAVAFMVASALSGVQGVLSGGGLYGYRATTEAALIASAYNPNRLAMFAIMAIAGLWYLMRSLQTPGLRYLIIPTIVVLALAVMMTASRSGMLGMAVCMIVIIIDERLSISSLLSMAIAGAMLVLLAVAFVPQRSLDRITNLPGTEAGQSGEGSGSLERRARTWGVAFDIFLDNPLLGVGMGNWEVARYLKDPARSTTAPHSSYLLAMVEGGIFCLFAFLALLWSTWRNLRWCEFAAADPDTEAHDLQWVIKAAKTSFLVMVFFSAFADLWQLVILFWLVGLSMVMRRIIMHQPRPYSEAF